MQPLAKIPNDLTAEQLSTVAVLTNRLIGFGVEVMFMPPVSTGPMVSVYRFVPKGRTRVTHIEALAKDLATALGVFDVQVRRLPGETTIGIYVPNKETTIIDYKKTVADVWVWQKAKEKGEHLPIPLNLGVDHLGRPFIEDLTQLPHLLIAGSTGGGKSTLLHVILSSMTYLVSSDRLRLILSDTKTVEFNQFVGLPHLEYEIAKSSKATVEQLEYVIEEMDERLLTIGKTGCRNIHEYNKRMSDKPMPYFGVVIDELADIMEYTPKDRGKGDDKYPGETAIEKIVQKARAAGIYMVCATQRPSVDIIRGVIKSNFTARLTFRLPTEADSRTVLGTGGAEHLLAKGDMLYQSPNRPDLLRLHSPYASTDDVKACVDMVIMKEN